MRQGIGVCSLLKEYHPVKRIAVAGFQHETNTFAPSLATYSEFEEADAWPGLLKNDEVTRELSGLYLELHGVRALPVYICQPGTFD